MRRKPTLSAFAITFAGPYRSQHQSTEPITASYAVDRIDLPAADGAVVAADAGGVRQVLCPVVVGREEEARHIEAALGACGCTGS
jgi:hypothetical protein